MCQFKNYVLHIWGLDYLVITDFPEIIMEKSQHILSYVCIGRVACSSMVSKLFAVKLYFGVATNFLSIMT